MQASPVRDFCVGLFVLAGLGALGYLSIQVGGLSYKGDGGFELTATFDEIGELKPRAAVVIAGVKVGKVESIELDPNSMRANVRLDVKPDLGLDADTRASILTSGLLGDQFVALEPGSSEDMLQPGDQIAYTESAVSIERLIGKFVQDSGLGEE